MVHIVDKNAHSDHALAFKNKRAGDLVIYHVTKTSNRKEREIP